MVGLTMWLVLLWAIGLVISMCVTVPFLVARDLDDKYTGVIIVLVLCPIINIIYPIYIIIRYIRIDFKKFL
jgi:hypothetical protein